VGSTATPKIPSINRIREVHAASRGLVRETPAFTLSSLSKTCGGRIVVKAENLQRTGSFKLRGAIAKVRTLDPRTCPGVVAGSAGNHAQALAYAARWRDLPCRVFMPEGAAISKVEAVRAFGARVEQSARTVDACVEQAHEVAAAEGLAFVHPFDDLDVIAGQAGVGLELVKQAADLRLILVPVGGGGLASGVALAVKRLRPEARVVGVQSAVWPALARSITDHQAIAIAGQDTLADGIAIKQPGELTLPILEEWLDDILVVEDDAVGEAMVFLVERAKLVAEGAGSVPVAALLAGVIRPAESGTTVALVSGGNVDAHVLAAVIGRHETHVGRRHRLFTCVPDRPGGLARLLQTVATVGGNVLDVTHVRDGVELPVGHTGVELLVETRGMEHDRILSSTLEEAGFEITPLQVSR
jgi:threonine dehydratase